MNYVVSSRNICLIAIALIAIYSSRLRASDKPDQQEAINRIQQAVAKTNIFELPSFLMKATVQIDVKGKLVDGTYRLLWNGADQWREEINFPGYGEVQVGGKGTIWTKRSTDFLPRRIFNLHEALGFGVGVPGSGGLYSGSMVQFNLSAKETIGKTRERKEHGGKLTCTQIEDQDKVKSEFCVSESSGTLVRGSPYFERDLQPAGSKIYPRSLGVEENGKPVATVNVTEFTTPAQFPAEAFIPPAGVAAQTGCMNPLPFLMIRRRPPEYPKSAREQHLQGSVAVYAVIGTDGVPRIRKVIESPNAEFEEATLRAINEWRYDPALCQGRPVEIETVLQINYTLSY